jgi:hypothetical protein
MLKDHVIKHPTRQSIIVYKCPIPNTSHVTSWTVLQLNSHLFQYTWYSIHSKSHLLRCIKGMCICALNSLSCCGSVRIHYKGWIITKVAYRSLGFLGDLTTQGSLSLCMAHKSYSQKLGSLCVPCQPLRKIQLHSPNQHMEHNSYP